MATQDALPGLPSLGKIQTIPRLRGIPKRNTGPRILQLASDPRQLGGPGEPPEGFVTAHTSRTEWVVYWAFARVLRDPPDPRKPPYVGGAQWSYQTPLDGGRVVGGQVVDFVYLGPKGKTVGVRVQTERFHIMTTSNKLVQDFLLKSTQRALDIIVDIFDQDFMGDESGKAACVVVANAIKGIQALNPSVYGRAQRIRGYTT